MSAVKEHYDHHLGNFYSWMVGDFEAKRNEQENFFRENKIQPRETCGALDLGCGHGIQSVALANLGFKVRAVDFNRQLLEELKRNSSDKSIEIVESDLLDTHVYLQPVDVVVCMGDTLTHLQTKQQVVDLIEKSSTVLATGGKLVLSFRDLTNELEGDQRFLPVRSDENRIHTCFLEYFHDRVRVTDILHELSGGNWHMKAGSYFKLKLTTLDVTAYLEKVGFSVIQETSPQRMIYLIAEKKKPRSKSGPLT